MSSHWTGAVPRFALEDFSEGERLHERHRWPVTYEELRPYYERAERLPTVAAATKDVPNLPTSYATHRCQLPGTGNASRLTPRRTATFSRPFRWARDPNGC
jgi:choline dehydrogenase-like flavoprotein